MAIKVVNSRYPGFIFDGENSRDYGVYITDVEVFGAPKRNVEMISIPGRNGNYALDKGSFENIPVKYKCVLGAGTEEDFNNGISDFRNWLASKVGYKTLSDEINLGEYRKGVFLEGMEVPTLNKQTGTFEVVFDCMPQRWLDDASSLPVEMASGDDIFNPTLFESSPLLSVWGYGDIGINGETITIDDAVIGDVLLANRMTSSDGIITFSEAQLRAGDDIRMGVSNVVANGFTEVGSTISNPSIIRTEGTIIKNATLDVGTERQIRLRLTLYQNAFESQDPTTKTAQVDIGYNYTPSGGSVQDYVVSCRVQIKYTTGKIEVSALFMSTIDVEFENEPYYETGNVKGYSTKSALGEPLHFDLDIGEAYKIEGGELISVNNAVSFPAELPTLKAGHNTVTFDNTIDKLVISPRWWKV